MNGLTYRGDPVENVLARLEHVKKEAHGWTARCPAHDDQHSSLSIGTGRDGRVLLKCHANKCTNEQIVARLGLRMSDLFPPKDERPMSTSYSEHRRNGSGPGGNEQKPVDIYKYRDENGVELYRVYRYEPKTFRQRRADGAWTLAGVRRVPYCLPELIQAEPSKPVFVVEGEKDAKRLMRAGCMATTNAGGAGKWPEAFNEYLAGRHVVILPDNDESGRKHADTVARSLQGCAASVKVVALPGLREKGDVSDYLDAGASIDDLMRLVEGTAEFKPERPAVTGGFQFSSLAELMDEPEPEVDWLVDGMLVSAGFSIIAARAKVGKSTLARNLAICVAQGRNFLSRPTSRGRVLYMALEEQRSEIVRDFLRMGAQREDPITVHTGAAPEAALRSLSEAIIAHSATLAVIDPLIKFTRLDDVNDYAKVYRALAPIVEVARSTGCHILALHHTNKLVQDGSSISTASVMGSSAFTANVDTTIIMHRNNENVRTMFTEQRTGIDMPPTVLGMDFDTHVITALGEVDEVALVGTMRKICEYLQETRDWTNQKDIRDYVKADPNKVIHALNRLVADGQLRKRGDGRKGSPFEYTIFDISIFPLIEGNIEISNIDSTNNANNANTEITNIQQIPEKPQIPLRLLKPESSDFDDLDF